MWFWFALKAISLPLASLVFLLSIVFGAAMSFGRLAAGAHFFSDAVWAALMCWWISYWTYYRIVNVPEVLRGRRLWHTPLLEYLQARLDGRFLKIAIPTLALTLTFISLLIVTPLDRSFELINSRPTRILVVEIDDADVTLSIRKDHPQEFRIQGTAKGFGFPWNKVYDACWERDRDSACQITKKGVYTDFESRILIELNPNAIKRFELKLRKGKVRRSESEPLPKDYMF